MVDSQTAVGISETQDVLQQLAALARARGPLRRGLSALAAQWVEREGWSRLGFARLGDYARERLGVSARSFQEWARVGAQVERLPALEAALVSGRLSWSKVRLLARFVAPEDERYWIAYADGVSVRQLEQELRAVDRGALGVAVSECGDGERTRHVRIRVPAPLAFKWQRTRRYAEKMEGQSLRDGDVLERLTAEVVSALPVVPEGSDRCGPGVIDDPPGRACREEDGEPECAPRIPQRVVQDQIEDRPELPVFLQPLLADLADADAFELDARLRRAVRLEQRLDAQLAPLVRQATSSEYEWKENYASLAVLARECLGMSPSKLRALLRVERLGEVCPELRDAYRDGGLSWVQAQALAPLLESDAEGEVGVDWRAAWVQFASTVTVRCLTGAVERARLWRKANPAGFEAQRADPSSFARADSDEARGERQTCARPTDVLGGVRLRIAAPGDVARLFDAVLCTVRLAIERETGQLPSEAEGFEVMLDHALESWGVDDTWLRRSMRKKHYAVLERDDWRCVFPGCTSRRNLHVHHIRFRSAGGSDEASNLTTLCAFHHQRGVHDGRVTVRGSAPDLLEFELGLRPCRAPLARFESGDRAV